MPFLAAIVGFALKNRPLVLAGMVILIFLGISRGANTSDRCRSRRYEYSGSSDHVGTGAVADRSRTVRLRARRTRDGRDSERDARAIDL